eukprot:scaffold395_cov383-Prasinococcus_capsulatus_cf.AAC.21
MRAQGPGRRTPPRPRAGLLLGGRGDARRSVHAHVGHGATCAGLVPVHMSHRRVGPGAARGAPAVHDVLQARWPGGTLGERELSDGNRGLAGQLYLCGRPELTDAHLSALCV